MNAHSSAEVIEAFPTADWIEDNPLPQNHYSVCVCVSVSFSVAPQPVVCVHVHVCTCMCVYVSMSMSFTSVLVRACIRTSFAVVS